MVILEKETTDLLLKLSTLKFNMPLFFYEYMIL